MTIEEYLHTNHGEWEPELVRGKLFVRPYSTLIHSRIQPLIGMRLDHAGMAVLSISLRISDDTIRIADAAVFKQRPAEDIPASPPLVVVEVIVPEDRHEAVMEKLEQYRTWGIENIWVVEPELQQFHVFDTRGLIEVKAFQLPGLRIDAAELFAEAIK